MSQKNWIVRWYGKLEYCVVGVNLLYLYILFFILDATPLVMEFILEYFLCALFSLVTLSSTGHIRKMVKLVTSSGCYDAQS